MADCSLTEQPTSAEELAAALSRAAASNRRIQLGGNFTKRSGAGPATPADVTISTAGLARILAYEPRDLTISVEAGMKYGDLRRTLAANHQMIPFDPPFAENATMGGIVASNSSGPRRRLYGTARDLVIGMKFATLEGKIIQSGGMVVKNVAGLDMGKLMIGSWGTLAAIASVNFKLLPVPAVERTMLIAVDSPAQAFGLRDRVIQSVLQPSAIDFVNLPAAKQLGYAKAVLALEFGGNAAVIERSRYEVSQWPEVQEQATEQSDDSAERFWDAVRNFTPKFLEQYSGGVVVRISTTLADMGAVLASLETPAIARAGSGVVYAYFSRPDAATKWMTANPKWISVIEYAPEAQKDKLVLWPSPGADMELMQRVKQMFDPKQLLNRGRYYRHF